MDIIAACIESGCYSAVFAIMLVFAVRTHIRREEYYRRIIGELTASLHDLEHVNVRLDEIIARQKRREKKKETPCGFGEPKTSAAGDS